MEKKAEKVKVLVEQPTLSKACSDGQLRSGKGNRNDEC